MSKINENENDNDNENENENEKNGYILKEDQQQRKNTEIINERTPSNYIDKLNQNYKNNKLISSYEEDYTRNNIEVMKLLLQRN